MTDALKRAVEEAEQLVRDLEVKATESGLEEPECKHGDNCPVSADVDRLVQECHAAIRKVASVAQEGERRMAEEEITRLANYCESNLDQPVSGWRLLATKLGRGERPAKLLPVEESDG